MSDIPFAEEISLRLIGGARNNAALPSLSMILYGIATETSIGRLFVAGVLPGLMLAADRCG